jgi:Icc-related predicted phosphoesterase
MRFGALGDIHGDFESVRRVMGRHPDIAFWLCVGDLADDQGRYEDVTAPLYWIKGNNENFGLIASGRFPGHLHYVPEARPIRVGGVTIAGLGGTFAPTWYDTPAADLPYPGGPAKARDDKRRHFVREEVDACKALRDVDVFMTHEAPRPYIVSGRHGAPGNDAGKTPVNEILAAVRPRLHLFGHHHRFTDELRQGVRSVGLDLASRSHLLIDAKTLELTKAGGNHVP